MMFTTYFQMVLEEKWFPCVLLSVCVCVEIKKMWQNVNSWWIYVFY